jgi:oligopeptide/dipeptide ABC transporter ATP-binding protein
MGVSLRVARGEALGLVGESGSGKSMTTRAVMRTLPPGAEATGRITYHGNDVLSMSRAQLASYRATGVGMIYQDPRAHTNPVRTVGDFLVEGVRTHGSMSRRDAEELAISLLRDVGIPDGARRMRQHPHQLSGGLLQRVMIVMALMPSPDLLLADEPTTALDVTIQSEVMAILDEQRRERGLAMVFITHDLNLAAAVCDDIAVMYAGSVVEVGPGGRVTSTPRHPYTSGLLGSRPSLASRRELVAIPGRPISAFEVVSGCAFAARCPYVQERCRVERPQVRQVDGRDVACHRTEEIREELDRAGAA